MYLQGTIHMQATQLNFATRGQKEPCCHTVSVTCSDQVRLCACSASMAAGPGTRLLCTHSSRGCGSARGSSAQRMDPSSQIRQAQKLVPCLGPYNVCYADLSFLCHILCENIVPGMNGNCVACRWGKHGSVWGASEGTRACNADDSGPSAAACSCTWYTSHLAALC